MSDCLQCPDSKKSPVMARGLCPRCYVRTKNQVAKGKTTWKALVVLGKATKPFSRFECLSAVIRQIPKEIAKLGSDNAPFVVKWRDAQGRQRSKVCGRGPDGLKAAEELKRRIEEDRHQPFRQRSMRDRTHRCRIPTPAGLVVVSDIDGKRIFRDAEGRIWCNAPATGLSRRILQANEDPKPINDGKPFTTSTVVRTTKAGRRAGIETVYLTSEIDHFKESRADFHNGIYRGTPINGEPAEDCITRGALARKSGLALSAFYNMEDHGLLTPKYFTSKGGYKIQHDSPRVTYKKSEALPAVEKWKQIWREPKKGKKRGGGFSGIWPDSRMTAVMASSLTGVPSYTILWMIKKGILPKEARKPPAPYHSRKRYVVDPAEVRKKKTWLKGIRREVDKIACKMKLSANRRSQLFNGLLAGKSFQDFAEEWRAAASGRNGNGEATTPVPAAPAEPTEQVYLGEPKAEQAQKMPATKLMSAPDLARATCQSSDFVDAFLRRYRKTNAHCYQEVDGLKNEPRIWYFTRHVWRPLQEHIRNKRR